MTTPIGHHAIVELVTDEGVTGWGEAPAGATWGGAHMRYFGETPETVSHVVRDYLLPAVSTLDPIDIGPIHSRMDKAIKGHPYAKAAVDMACYDAAGKALGVSVAQMLGGSHRDGIEVAHSLGIMELDRCYAEAEQAVAEGATTIKCKTGLDPERDVLLVRELRRRLGDAIRIRVDGNEGYPSVSAAVEVTRRQEEYGLLLCEQPVAGARGLAQVARRIESPVMADESAWTVNDILELHELEAAECFSCYVTKPGGLYRARQQAEVAEHLGIYCDIGGSIETGIGNAANLALGVSLRNAVLPSVCPVSRPAGSGGPEIVGVYYVDDLITESFAFVDGKVQAPTGPGLGITVDRAKLERYAV
jgi:muconate cycloisomerase